MAAPSSAAPNAATERVGQVPTIQIALKNEMRQAPPQEMSQTLYDKYLANEADIGYTWDWATHGLARGGPTMKRRP